MHLVGLYLSLGACDVDCGSLFYSLASVPNINKIYHAEVLGILAIMS